MIFRAISIYRKAKKGMNNPAGFVTDEVRDAFIGAMIVHLIVLILVTTFLGILSFSHLIMNPSILAQVFFWIFIVAAIIYGSIFIVLKSLLERVLRKIELDNRLNNNK